MADASVFLRKRKDKQKRTVPAASSSSKPSIASSHSPLPFTAPAIQVKAEPSNNPDIQEFRLISTGRSDGLRYNIMKLNSGRESDPTELNKPLLTRKQPGPKAPPIYAVDNEGKPIGKLVYDDTGKPVIGADGRQVVEKKDEMDMTLVGINPGGERKKGRKAVKEVFNQDIEVIRLRREEATPWVLESGRPQEKSGKPEHWVGRYVEPSAMPTVLLISDSTTRGGGNQNPAFKVVSLGRTYRFNPERPFKVLDPDAAHKLFEHQTKYKIHDRWAQREGGPEAGPSVKSETYVQLEQERRAIKMEQRMRATKDVKPKVRVERFDDDSRREGRKVERGLEGGLDEELDYDANEDFQDDEDNNTFYRNEEEEEDAKIQEDRLKKEFRLANANVGDKPQIDNEASDEDLEDLFGDTKLNTEGRRLRKQLKQKAGNEDMYGDPDSDESDEETPAKEKEDKKPDTPKPTDRPTSRPPSRGPGPNNRGTSSPTGRRLQPPIAGKASTAPPGTGAALLAQRAASRGASPLRNRANSPSSRATSPENNRAMSPTPRAGSPSTTNTRDISPAPSASTKRKQSPTPGSVAVSKKKKSSSTTPTPDPFPGMITSEEVFEFFKKQKAEVVPMSEVINEFKNRLTGVEGKHKAENQALFLGYVRGFTRQDDKRMLRINPGIREG